MKVEQRAEINGDDVVLRVISHPSGQQVGLRIYEGLAKYAAFEGKDVVIRIPARAGLNIKPGPGQS